MADEVKKSRKKDPSKTYNPNWGGKRANAGGKRANTGGKRDGAGRKSLTELGLPVKKSRTFWCTEEEYQALHKYLTEVLRGGAADA